MLTVSDRVARGEAEDASGPALVERLAMAGWSLASREVVPDEIEAIAAALVRLSDHGRVPLVLTTGGTGIAPRDVTPEATRRVVDREVPGIAEALRAASLDQTPHAMLSCAIAGIRGGTLIVNLPGSPRGARQTFDVLAPVLDHAVALLSAGEALHRAADRT
ncbi:MAG TPA: MogA/MoaB family molybdenum cofactor biosynthesis protein [Gemmatimonadota bacterium]|nr:MogA/MoaB family molybdenum cofactor biosynthesis protein [Gemmatimonadota bacterium]